MTIYGLSQTTGVERTLDVARTADGVLLHSRDHESHRDIDRIVVELEPLLGVLADRPDHPTSVPGLTEAREAERRVEVTVRGNEVLLAVATETGNSWDIAVGLDDFQDALGDALEPA